LGNLHGVESEDDEDIDEFDKLAELADLGKSPASSFDFLYNIGHATAPTMRPHPAAIHAETHAALPVVHPPVASSTFFAPFVNTKNILIHVVIITQIGSSTIESMTACFLRKIVVLTVRRIRAEATPVRIGDANQEMMIGITP